MNDRQYPVLSSPSLDSAGAVLTPDVLDKMLARIRSPEYAENIARAERESAMQAHAVWERIEQNWLKMHGATEMTPALREKLDEEAWKWMVRHTNILEVLD